MSNYDSSGVARADPIEDGKTFPERADAIEAYDAFLVRWTESHRELNPMTGEMELVEEGNSLAPAEPIDPSRPATVVQDDIGAW